MPVEKENLGTDHAALCTVHMNEASSGTGARKEPKARECENEKSWSIATTSQHLDQDSYLKMEG